MHVDMHSQHSARYWICHVTCLSDRLLRILIFLSIIIVLEKVTAHNACRHTFSTVCSRLNSLGTCLQCTLFWIFNMFEVSVTHNSNRRIFLTFSSLLNSQCKIAIFWEFSIFWKNSSRTIQIDVYSYYSARYWIHFKRAVFWEYSIFWKNSSRTIQVDIYSYYSACYWIHNRKEQSFENSQYLGRIRHAQYRYGVATMSRRLKITGLFWRI